MDMNATAAVISFSYQELYAIIPCIFLGLGSGCASYFSNFLTHEDYHGSWRKMIGTTLSSGIIAFIVFALLDSTNLTFMTKLALSAAVSFLGIDKALDLAQKILNLRGQK